MRRLILSIVCLGFVACAARGALIDDNFESYTVGNSIHGVNGWTVINQTGSQDGLVAAEDSPFTGGAQSVRYLDSDSTSTLSNLRLRNTLPSSITSGTFTFDYKAVAAPWFNPSFIISDSSGTAGVLVNIITGGTAANRVRYHNGSTMVDVAPNSLTLGTWYRAEITIADLSGAVDTFNMRLLEWNGVSGTEVFNVSNIGFKANIANINSIEFGTNAGPGGSGSEFFADNVQVIPEPATLGLTCLTTFGLLVVRRTFIL